MPAFDQVLCRLIRVGCSENHLYLVIVAYTQCLLEQFHNHRSIKPALRVEPEGPGVSTCAGGVQMKLKRLYLGERIS